jgi:hypothetical protein
MSVLACELSGPEVERWWAELVRVWPAFARHYAATNERAVFVLTPTNESHQKVGAISGRRLRILRKLVS